jgi:hypothetical protein
MMAAPIAPAARAAMAPSRHATDSGTVTSATTTPRPTIAAIDAA